MWGWGAAHYIQWAPEMSFLCAHPRPMRTWWGIRNRVCASFQALPYPNERCVYLRKCFVTKIQYWSSPMVVNLPSKCTWKLMTSWYWNAFCITGSWNARPVVGFSHNGPVKRRFEDELSFGASVIEKCVTEFRAWMNNHIHIFVACNY